MEQKIRQQVNEILDSITCPKLKNLVKTKTFLTGGCFKAIVNKEKVNDWDFYFVDEKSAKEFEKLINKGLTNTKKAFTDRSKMWLYDLKHKSQFAITFKLNKETKVQFITKYSGSPEKVTGNFDFAHTRNYYIPAWDVFHVDYNSLMTKQLIFNPAASHPINALKRMQKFIKQGWEINDSNIMSIAESINKLNLKDDKEYKEQASGMYLYRESKMRGYNSKRNIG